jgi:cytidine deaminase
MTDYSVLMEKAKEASKNAYAPYSNFKVGACVLAESGNMYTGCNFENSSYGLTICAERNAIGTAIVAGEHKILAVAIYSPNRDNCYPCGACRQVIHEFRSNNGTDVITEADGNLICQKIERLLPEGFSI